MSDQVGVRAYMPERLPVRGEITAWVMAMVVLVTATILRVNQAPWATVALILAGVFVLSAGSISFGNWMDRQTVIRLDEAGVRFSNGVRRANPAWGEIQAVRVLPAQWGARQVQVVGEMSGNKFHFEFRTLGMVNFQGRERGRTGFAEGEEILETILRKARLQSVPSDDPSYLYYVRK